MPDLDIFELPVHPAADIFPMLDSEELDDLAADIKANGLLFPVVVAKVDGEWTLVDGRNRREACRRAGVEPQVQDLNGTDPLLFIRAANLKRRHLSSGQRAMADAKTAPEADIGAPGKRSKILESYDGNDRKVMQEAIRKARLVLRVTPTAVDRVLAGTLALDAAFKAADTESKRDQLERDADARLERKAPALFNRYKRGELSRAEAEAIHSAEEKEDRERREHIFETAVKLLKAVRSAGGTAIRELPAVIADADHYAAFKAAGGDIAYDPDIRQELEAVFSTMREVLGSLPPRQRAKRNGGSAS